MTVRLTLISPATSQALRDFRFDDDSPLDPAGRARAEAAAAATAQPARAYTSPSLRCRQTARALGLRPEPEPVADLAGCAMGRWRGQTLDAVAAAEAEAVAAWMTDPAAAPHGGESLRGVRIRVGAWLDALPELSGTVTAVAEPDVIRAAVVHALAAPDETFWRVDVRPLTATHFTGRAHRWNLRIGGTLEQPAGQADVTP